MKPSHDHFHHPYHPYDIQLDFMQNLYSCIEDRNVAIFESPTGTGKSLSLICAAITWLRDDQKRRSLGSIEDEDSCDWLEKAERQAQRRQLLETRRELEQKLESLRKQDQKKSATNQEHYAKRVKIDTTLDDDDLTLDDYESDEEPSKTNGTNHVLSATTQALLDQFAPSNGLAIDISPEPTTKIIFCSRTHSQLGQFVSELRKISLSQQQPDDDPIQSIKQVPLASRKQLCVNPKVSYLASSNAINERCLDLQRPNVSKDKRCDFLLNPTNPNLSTSDRQRLQDFTDRTLATVQDIEDIAALGRKKKICPYYATRTAIGPAEIVTLPYPLLLQKSARQAMGLEVKDNIVIIDEAHNLIDAIAGTVSVSVSVSHLKLAQKQLLGYCAKFRNKLKGKNRVYLAQLIKLVRAVTNNVENGLSSKGCIDRVISGTELISGENLDQIQPSKLVHYIQESKLVYKVEGYAETVDPQGGTEGGVRQPRGVLTEFVGLLAALANPSGEGRFFVVRDGIKQEITLKYNLLNPQEHFRDIVQSARAVILAGGTMSPMADFHDQLFTYLSAERLKTFSFGHIVARENVLVQPLVQGLTGVEFSFTFSTRADINMILELGLTIENLCTTTPDGMVVFFASYDYLKFVVQEWERAPGSRSVMNRIQSLRQVFTEGRDSDVDALLGSYTSAVLSGHGALLLAVIGGKLSEGINFSDRLGRVVVCVGLPFPNPSSAEWRAKIEYLKKERLHKLQKQASNARQYDDELRAVEPRYASNVTMRAVNQSIGRAIRHQNDYAAIFLVDKRYSKPEIQGLLPAWLKESIRPPQKKWKDLGSEIKAFFTARQAD